MSRLKALYAHFDAVQAVLAVAAVVYGLNILLFPGYGHKHTALVDALTSAIPDTALAVFYVLCGILGGLEAWFGAGWHLAYRLLARANLAFFYTLVAVIGVAEPEPTLRAVAIAVFALAALLCVARR